MNLSTPEEIDVLLRWTAGRADRLAKKGQLPHYVLPDGVTIRFDQAEIEAMVHHCTGPSIHPNIKKEPPAITGAGEA